jgi:hypothetical protein
MPDATKVYKGVKLALLNAKTDDEDEVNTATFKGALPRALRRAKNHCLLKAKTARAVIASTAAMRRCVAEHCAAGTDEDYDESKETAAIALACATYALRAGLDVARVADEYFAVAARVEAAQKERGAEAAAKLVEPHTQTSTRTVLNADNSTTTTTSSRVMQPDVYAAQRALEKARKKLPPMERPTAALACVAPGMTCLTRSGDRSGNQTVLKTVDRIQEHIDGQFSVYYWNVEPPVPEHERGGLFATREGAEAHRDDLRRRGLLPIRPEQTDPVEGLYKTPDAWRFKVPGSSNVTGEKFSDFKLKKLKIKREYKFGDVRANAKNFRDKMIEWLHSEARATTPPPKPEDFGGVVAVPKKRKRRCN